MNDRSITPRCNEWPRSFDNAAFEPIPHKLYLIGRELADKDHSIAIVGTRWPTAAGVDAATEIASGLAEAGFTIVSGLALGIDTVAHKAALDSGGHTVAVLGAGLDRDYPQRNRNLRRQIEQKGTVVTEYPVGTEPRPQNFPARNRIIAGLCRGVVVIEGNRKSGALITARFAWAAERPVWALPGSVRNPRAAGPNELIRTNAATLVTEVNHIFQDVSPQLVWSKPSFQRSGPPLEKDELAVLAAMDDEAVSPDQITEQTGFSLGVVGLTLARLEVRGMVNSTPLGYVLTTAGARVRPAVDDEVDVEAPETNLMR